MLEQQMNIAHLTHIYIQVAYVEKDSKVYSEIVQYNAPWGLARISHREPLGFITFTTYKYDATAGSDVTFYIVDTGINIDHVDFGSRARWGHTVPDNDEDADNHGHGTHVAGTAVGTRFGVAKKANVVAVKVLNSEGRGSTSDVIKGVEYVVKSHADEMRRARKDGRPFKGSVANLSLGGAKSRSLDGAINAVSVVKSLCAQTERTCILISELRQRTIIRLSLSVFILS